MKFSVIIPVMPGRSPLAAASLLSSFPADPRYEIIITEGHAPSQQRNQAAELSTGDLLYFIDDDSRVDCDVFSMCSALMEDPDVAVVGGPSITPSDDTRLQQLFGMAVASAFGSGPVRNRYRATGTIRVTTDKELILCNLVVRRSVFMEIGGFNQCLYPNEENEFLGKVADAGYKMYHNPSMSILRSQRRTVTAFVRQMFNYGRGRAQQSLVTSSFSVVSFVPMFFAIYLVAALVLAKYVLIRSGLVIYLGALIVSTCYELVVNRRVLAAGLLFIHPLMHFVNGVGLLYGLTTGKPRPVTDADIKLRRIKQFTEEIHAGDR